jgi:hypothetical protein
METLKNIEENVGKVSKGQCWQVRSLSEGPSQKTIQICKLTMIQRNFENKYENLRPKHTNSKLLQSNLTHCQK